MPPPDCTVPLSVSLVVLAVRVSPLTEPETVILLDEPELRETVAPEVVAVTAPVILRSVLPVRLRVKPEASVVELLALNAPTVRAPEEVLKVPVPVEPVTVPWMELAVRTTSLVPPLTETLPEPLLAEKLAPLEVNSPAVVGLRLILPVSAVTVPVEVRSGVFRLTLLPLTLFAVTELAPPPLASVTSPPVAIASPLTERLPLLAAKVN